MDQYVTTPAGKLHYRVDGPEDGPPLFLSNSLGTTLDMWFPQVERLRGTFRLITYDTRGHGQSSVPAGEYSLDELGEDAVCILDAAGVEDAHVCGLSLGGLTAMWLGVYHPSRLRSLVLADTAARIGTVERWIDRVAKARTEGMSAIADLSMNNWFTADYRGREPAVVARFHAMVASCSLQGYLGCCAALREADLRPLINQVRARTLVVNGDQDPSTTVTDAEYVSSQIPNATLLTLGAAHLTNVECPDSFSRHLELFVMLNEQAQHYGATS
jgi:3-oxoadipate enol-lactonase